MESRRYRIRLAITSFLVLMLLMVSPAYAPYIDDRYGILISVAPQKYHFDLGETVLISGEVYALRNHLPLILEVFNANNTACSFQQLPLDENMRFKANPIKLAGTLCSVKGEYKVTVYYGSGMALTKFRVVGPDDELTGGKAEVVNSKIVSNFLKLDHKYPIRLEWTTNAVFVQNNMNHTIRFYLMFTEFDANEAVKRLSYKEVTLEPMRRDYILAPFVPHIIAGKPNGYLHVFAWTNLNVPTPLHPGLYVPY